MATTAMETPCLYSIIVLSFLSSVPFLVSSSNLAVQVEKLPEIPASTNDSSLSNLKSFEGLSGQIYFLNESYPEKQVVKIMGFPYRLDVNDTTGYAFKCKFIHPIIAPGEVYLEIVMRDRSSLFFTGARKLTDNKPRHHSNNSVSWTEEYEFQVRLDVKMYLIQCVGMDVNERAWRKDWKVMYTAYGEAPSVLNRDEKGDDHHRMFTTWQPARLECPISTGVPAANFTWNTASGGQEQEGRELFIRWVTLSDQGRYTCVAKNKYGNSSYTFTVRVDDPPLLEKIATLWQEFRFACQNILGILAFSIFYRPN